MARQEQKSAVWITGCSGLIGSRLMNALQDDYGIVGFDVEAPDKLPEGATYIQCDLTDDDSVAEAVTDAARGVEGPIASVIHLAAYYDFSGEPSPMYDQLTVEGTRRLLRALQPHEPEQFVFASTLLVMKSAADDGRTLDETSPLEAEWDYPQSKVRAEEVIEKEHGAIPAVVLRVAGAFDDDCHSLPISQQIRRIYEKELESYFYPGDKSHGQPFVHLDDLTDCFVKAVEHRAELDDHEIFLVAEDDLMSYEELQDEIGRLTHGDEWTTIRIPKPVAKLGALAKEKIGDEDPFIKPWMVDLADQHYPVSVDKAKEKLEWRPRHTLRETLPRMISALKQDPQRWYRVNDLPMPRELQTK